MKRMSWPAVALAAVLAAWGAGLLNAPSVLAEGDTNAYFNALVGRTDHWKSWSLRSAAQVTWQSQGGFIACSPTGCPDQLITYSPTTDRDAHAQDAAKVRVPPFLQVPGGGGVLTKAMTTNPGDPDYNWVYVKTVTSGYVDRQMRVDTEVMTIPYYRPGTS